MRRLQRRLRLIRRVAGSGRAFLAFRRTRPCRLRTPIRSTHSIHPMAQINREWNHSQGAGDPPVVRRFARPEFMIHVKCNIHSWMQAYIGVVDNPYFAVSGEDGSYRIGNLPPGIYTVAIWQEKLGTQEQQVTVAPHSNHRRTLPSRGRIDAQEIYHMAGIWCLSGSGRLQLRETASQPCSGDPLPNLRLPGFT